MTSHKKPTFLAVAIAAAFCGPATADELPQLTLDPDATTVSGLSSGAYMAVQMHVAFSERFAGAGIVAGGPYFCARGSLGTALTQCMQTHTGAPNAAALLQAAQGFAAADEIDPLAGLADDRVYLFSGTADNTVTQPAMDSARDFYLAAGVASQDIRYVNDVPAGHAFLAEGAPNRCSVTQANFINDCDIDQAGDILTWVYGDLADPVSPNPNSLLEFDQSAFLPNPEPRGMDSRGFVYVPEDCAAGETCRLHVAFHGCQQTPDQIGDLYARTTGYNRWAEANGIVVLYPQAHDSSGNPNGCWDWWGYDDADYALREGRQMAAVAAMANRLGAPFPEGEEPGGICLSHAALNWTHWTQDRAEFCGFGAICAVGSGDAIGFWFGATTLFEQPEGFYSTTPCQ